MGASLKDIACKLNLSKTTVSWVLSGQGDKKGISAETQSRVLACARSLAYEPNLLARSLNTGVSKTIGLILPSISDTFFAHIADRIESEAEREGYSLMIAGSNSETERENALIRLFRSKKVDGIIIAPADASGREVGRLAESGCPVVLFDRGLAKTDAGCVVIDNPPFSILSQICRFFDEHGYTGLMPSAYRKLCDACITFYFRCTDNVEEAAALKKELKDRLKAYEQQGAEWIEKLPARTRMGYKLFEICPAIYGKLLSRMQEAG